MAKAIAARMFGDDYQSRMFWIQVCRMFDERSKVVKVELEAENVKSLDDIVVHFEPPLIDCSEEVRAEYYQVKFHVTHEGAFTWQALIDPGFINAVSVSLLQRIRNAQQSYAPQGIGCRFIIYSPWAVHPENEMATLWSADDGKILWDRLSKGGPRSKMGKVREAWKKHLGLDSDEELRRTIAPVRIRSGPHLDEIKSRLNDKLCIAGLVPVVEEALSHPYDDLSRSFVKCGRSIFTRADIESICKQEKLWRGTTVTEPSAKRIGVRSFIRATEYLEDATDEHLCLTSYFEGRKLRDSKQWDEIYLEVETFLRRAVVNESSHHIHLPTHGTIAFAAGYCLDSKTGVNIIPVQSTSSGRVLWRPGRTTEDSNSKWQTEVLSANTKGHQLAIAISVTHNISNDIVSYVKRDLPIVGRVLHLRLPIPGVNSIRDGEHGYCLVQHLISEIRSQRVTSERGSWLHFFWAAPNAFAFFLGQMARNLGPCVLYEYDFESGRPGAYQQSLSLPIIANGPNPNNRER